MINCTIFKDIYVKWFRIFRITGSVAILGEKLEKSLNILMENLGRFVGTHFANTFMILLLNILILSTRYSKLTQCLSISVICSVKSEFSNKSVKQGTVKLNSQNTASELSLKSMYVVIDS